MFCISKHIVLDNGSQFVSSDFKFFKKNHNILHILTPPYYPQSNGQVKRFIQSLKSVIKKGMKKAGSNLEEFVTDL